MEWAQICSVLSPRPHPKRSPPHPCQGSPGVKWRHLEGDNLSAARTQGPNDLMANGICGAPVEKTKLGPPTLVASAPLWGHRVLGFLCLRAQGKGMQSPRVPWAQTQPSGVASGMVDLPVGDSLQGTAVAAGQPERTVGEDVGTVGDAQDQQVAPRSLQQGLQPCFQAAAGDERSAGGSYPPPALESIPMYFWVCSPGAPTHGLTGCSGHTPPCSPSCHAAEASGSAVSASGPACTTAPALPGTAKREGSPGVEGSEPGWLEVGQLLGRRPHENILESQARGGVLSGLQRPDLEGPYAGEGGGWR